MEFSYWEHRTWFSDIDFTVVGSGIVGINCALRLKERFPNAKVVVLEKGILPQGASTKNAGFACFGSISEILADLASHSEQEVVQLVKHRLDGIQLLRRTLGDDQIGYQKRGGHELFLEHEKEKFYHCLSKLSSINALFAPIFRQAPFTLHENSFNFKGIHNQYITHQFEGQLDTGKMMDSLLHLALKKGVKVLNGMEVISFEDFGGSVILKIGGLELKTHKLFVATNGFAQNLLDEDVSPARAQVVITKPIDNLHIKGTFHFDEGYFYFRNIDDRVLFGGGRNLDFDGERTQEFGQTAVIQSTLERLLREVILPQTSFEIEHRWSGIMGVGHQKKPVVKQLSNSTFCGVRLGGMGIAIGTAVGVQLADLIE